MTVVIDASAALAWLLRSQATPAAWAFLAAHASRGFEAPEIFEWEVRNVLLSLGRRGMIEDDDYDAAVASLSDMDLAYRDPVADVSELSVFARRVGLSLFDAAYLALALDRDCALASRDAGLLRVAEASGVECFDLRGTA